MSLLTAVNVETIHDIWPWVRDGLKVVAKKGGGGFLPEDVYAALRNPQAYTYLLIIGQQDGFVVVQRVLEPNGPCMHIYAIYGSLAHIEQELYAELDTLARGMGARKVKWHSKRRWGLRDYGKPVMTIFEREL